MEIDAHPRWRQLAQQLATLAGTRFIDTNSGFVLEFFDAMWQPLTLSAGQRVEPGHQFEWAWLLFRWSTLSNHPGALERALVLFERTEAQGIDRQRHVAINALTPDGGLLDTNAPPLAADGTAQGRAARRGADEQPAILEHRPEVRSHAGAIPGNATVGLWRDTLTADGEFIEEPAPASSLYHIAAAIAQLNRSVRRAVPIPSLPVAQR